MSLVEQIWTMVTLELDFGFEKQALSWDFFGLSLSRLASPTRLWHLD